MHPHDVFFPPWKPRYYFPGDRIFAALMLHVLCMILIMLRFHNKKNDKGSRLHACAFMDAANYEL